ncbi:MAG: pyridoxal phosphate-dependent aminotransferase, partial [Oscillospiraceae bacterium]|nr:pyridoxal phosphate-dependent aminotransferase [Oscillospiraceae bacterium]
AQPIIDALQKRLDMQIYGYTDYNRVDLKKSVSDWFLRRHDWNINTDDIFFSPGVVPAIAVLINILTEPGDGIIIQRPVYYPFTAKIENNGRKVVNNPLVYENGAYTMNFADLESKLANPENKGLILCNPHNPIGRVWTRDELLQVVELCKKYDKWIISDEIHCDLTRIGIKHYPLLSIAPEYSHRIIACTAPSKTFNLAGMHLSNIVIPNDEYKKAWKHFINERLGMDGAGVFSVIAMHAAYTEGEEWLDQLREYLDGNIAYIKDFTEKHLPKAHMVDCQGTYLVWLDLNGYCRDHVQLEQLMQNKARLALDEGYIFGEEGIGFERINVASPRSVIEDCMNRLKNTLE